MSQDKFSEDKINFNGLIDVIQQVHRELSVQAGKAVNISLTLRNWFIGCYIAEYELHGSDRARYGKKLLSELAKKLNHLSNCNRRQLYDYLKFYRTYPQIVGTLSAQLKLFLPEGFAVSENKVPTLSAQLHLPAEQLISCLSYSIFKLLVNIDDEIKQAFYEIECVRGTWSVRELDRQIGSLYYERSGLSKNMLLQNMHWPVWTIICSCQNICWSSRKKKIFSVSSKKNSRSIVMAMRLIDKESVTPQIY